MMTVDGLICRIFHTKDIYASMEPVFKQTEAKYWILSTRDWGTKREEHEEIYQQMT